MSLGPGLRCVSTTGGTATSERTFWSFWERVEEGNWKRYKIGDSVVVAPSVPHLEPPIFERNAKLLTSLFPKIQLEMYEGRQHLDPPLRAEPERFARALHERWARRSCLNILSRPAQLVHRPLALPSPELSIRAPNLTEIGAVRDRAADRVDCLVADNQVEVCSLRIER